MGKMKQINNKTGFSIHAIENQFPLTSVLYVVLFAVLISIGAWIRIPTSSTPIVMTTVFIYLAGLILGKNKAFFATVLYILFGLVGLPVFSGGNSGFNHIHGPTGGYLVGFMAAAWLIGGISEKFKNFSSNLSALVVGSLTIHSMGIMWMYFKFPEIWEGTKSIYITYIIADSLKILFVLFITHWLKRIRTKKAIE
jgi:biotin transport system substrate-specific component